VRRRKTNASYLAQFVKAFGSRSLHEIESLEIHDWTRSKKYVTRTCNDMLNLISQLYKWSIIRHHALHNPAATDRLKRGKVKHGDIGIFSAEQARKLLYAISDELKPFVALWLFAGLRKEEIGRLTWEQVQQGMDSGNIYLSSSQSKTGEARAVPIADNLKCWLTRYRQRTGFVFPSRLRGKDEEHLLQRLDDLTGYLTRKLGYWIHNAPRHSFATFHLALHKDPARTVSEMGTSLVKLQKHYWARAKNVTTEQAKEWFSIEPCEPNNVVLLPQAENQMSPESVGVGEDLLKTKD
jgi:integrase